MYSVVLATMMTLTPAAPDWHGGYGCHGCYGCGGVNAFTACSGCCGCYGGYSCYGYCSGYTCHGCYGCWGYTCHGCYGGSCCGCYGYAYYVYYPVYCPPVIVVPEKPKLPEPKKEKDEAKVNIKTPADVRLTVDGQPLKLQGTAQTFETPKLEVGHTYSYVFRAEAQRDGKVVARERKVTVRAGETTQLDFNDLFARAAARVTIVMPPDAKLIVDNVPCPEAANKRTFDTPDLEAGRRYTYTMRAEVQRDGKVVRQEKLVDVEAGKEVTVEFKDLPPLQAASR